MLDLAMEYAQRSANLIRLVVLACLIILPALAADAAKVSSEDAGKELEMLKAEMEGSPNASMIRRARYSYLQNIVSDCSPMGQVLRTFRVDDGFAPMNNLCINGSLGAGDPTYNRPNSVSTGSGLEPSCTPSGSGTAVFYDAYSFNLTGCSAFPNVVTTSLCGPAGCTAPQSMDTILVLYRGVAAGDALTANGGLPTVFNPASPCSNAQALNDDTGATPTSAGGSTCNQLNTSDCMASCPNTALSQMKRSLGSGRFTIVVANFSNGVFGNYNLYVDAPGAGCAVALAPSAASSSIFGRVISQSGRGIGKAIVSVSGPSLAGPVTTLTNAFGYYTFPGLEAGSSYSIAVSAKGQNFAEPTRIVTVNDDAVEIVFTSLE